jgi:hypothetical protein
LTKDLRRSPKKTAVLALLGVVALWFWAPLAWKWFAPKSSKATASAASASTTATTTTPSDSPSVAAPSATPSAPSLDWKELADILQHDPLLASAHMHETINDPFAELEVEQAAKESQTNAEQLATAAVEVRPTPEELGLTISSMITGGRRAVATINGRPCRIGDVIVVPAADKEFEFTVTNIDVDEVTLAANDETHVLSSRRPKSAMQLSQAGTTHSPHELGGGQRIVIGTRIGE